MSKFKTIADCVNYPKVRFYPRPYYVSFSVDFDTTPLIPHVKMLFHPYVEPGKSPSGADQHWHVPFHKRDAERLRDWLDQYLLDRDTN